MTRSGVELAVAIPQTFIRMLNPVFDEMEHLEAFASLAPKL